MPRSRTSPRIGHDVGPAAHVEPDRRLVAQQQLRIVQQSAARSRCAAISPPDRVRILRSASLARLMRASSAAMRPRDLCPASRARPRGRRGSAAPSGRDRSRAAGTPRPCWTRRRSFPLRTSCPNTADAALLRGVEPRHQRQQRGLAGAVRPQQHDEAPRRHGEGHVLQHRPAADAMRQAMIASASTAVRSRRSAGQVRQVCHVSGSRRPRATRRPGWTCSTFRSRRRSPTRRSICRWSIPAAWRRA